MKDRLVLMIVICTLGLVQVAVIGVLLSGLFQPVVDNRLSGRLLVFWAGGR